MGIYNNARPVSTRSRKKEGEQNVFSISVELTIKGAVDSDLQNVEQTNDCGCRFAFYGVIAAAKRRISRKTADRGTLYLNYLVVGKR